MEDNTLPPDQTVSPSGASASLDSASTTVPVSSFSSPTKQYPIESLEVHAEGTPPQSVFTPPAGSVPFSRRRAIIVSLVITLLVTLITGATAAFLIKKGSPELSSSKLKIPSQDVSIGEAASGLPELEGSGNALLVNGNLIARGNLEVISGDFTSVIRSDQLTGNQTLTLPNSSGTICLDVNNCKFATDAQIGEQTAKTDQQAAELAQQAAALAALQAQLGQLVIPPAGVTSLNDQTGAVTIQGSLNQISVATANGVITLTTPQALDTNANVQFGNMTLSSSGKISANTLQQTATGNDIAINAGSDDIVFTVGGRTFQLPTSGPASQTICTTAVGCAGGGGGVSDINGQNGSVTLQGTSNQVTVTTGSGTITLSTPQNINTTSSPTFAGLTLTSALSVNSGGTGLATTPTNGQLLIGNGSGYSLSTLSNGGGVNITNGSGTISIAVNYGSSANTAVQGNTTLVCAGGIGNLSGGGNTITLGSGGACSNISIVNNPTFTTSVTTPSLVLTGAGSNGALQVANLGQATTYTLPDPGQATANICLSTGNCAGSGGGVTTSGGTTNTIPLFTGSQTIGNSIITQSGTTIDIAGSLTLTNDLTVSNGGTGASTFTSNGVLYGNGAGALQATAAGTSGQVLLANGSGVPTFTTASGDVTISNTGVTAIQPNSVALGTDTTGNYVASLGTLTGLSTTGNTGEGSTPTLSVLYGSTANTAVQGNTTLNCPSGTGNLNGGGTAITLGSGGTCAALNTVQNPTFTTSVTTPDLILTGAGSNGSLQVANLGQATTYTLPDPGQATANICLSTGNCAGSGGGVTTPGGTTNTIPRFTGSQTIGDSIITQSGTTISIGGSLTLTNPLGIGSGGTGLATTPTNGQLLIGNGSGYTLATLSNNGGLTITNSGGSIGLAVNYGSSANTAVQGNTTLTCPSGTGNLTGGGTSITLGTGGTCANLNTVNNPNFSTSVTTPLLTSTGALAITPGGALTVGATSQTAVLQGSTLSLTSTGAGNDITLTSANQIVLNAGSTIELQDNTNLAGNLVATGTGTFQGASILVGGASQAGSLILNDGSSNTGTLQLAALGQDTTYTLPDPGAPSASICLSTGNCAGAGGGITGSGTANRVAKFTGSGTIGNSTITDDGTDVSITGDFTLQGGDITVGTSSQLGSLILQDGNGQTTTVRAGDSSGNLTYILPTASGSTNQCIKQSSTASQLFFDNCDGGAGGSSTTLQQAYTNGNTINTSTGRDIAFTLSNDATDSNFAVTIADDSTSTIQFVRANGTGTNNPAQLLLLDNQDTNQPIADGLRIQAAGGGITDAIDVSDAELVNALNVGDNTIVGTTAVIDFTNFDVLGNGNTSIGGTLAVTGTVTGGTYNGQTISSGASFTGTLNVAGATTLQTTLTVQGASATIGGTSQQGSLILNDGSSNTGTLQTAALGQDTTYVLPDPGQASVNICLSTGNCAGSGGGITGSGTANTIAKFTGAGTIGNSSITDNGTAVAVGANTSVTGTLSATGNINTSGGVLQTNSTTRVDNSGNLTNIGNITGTGAITVASTGAGNDVTIDGADQFIVQDAAVFNDQAAFNSDVDYVFTDTENLSIGSTVTGTNSVSVLNMLVTNNSTSGNQNLALLQNAAGTGTTEGLLVLDNADTDTAVGTALAVTSAAGGITTAIDVSDADIVNAILFGANDVIGTNFTIAGASGAVTGGTYNGQTISSTASFTGTLNVAGATTLQSTLAVQGASATIGGSSQQGSLILNDGSSNTGTLQTAALGQDTTYTLPDPGVATANICLSTGNCAGAGGGITGSGTANTVAKFTGTGTLGNSSITDNGTTVAVTGNLTASGNADIAGTLFAGTSDAFQVSSSGTVTAVGVNAGSGLLQGTGGLTLTGATNINTTGTANTSVGNATGTLALTSSGLNVTTAGAVSGVTTLAASGAITGSTYNSQTISSTANFTGTLNVVGATTLQSTLAVQGASVTVGTASTTNGTLKLQNATNAFATTISAPNLTTGNATISLPDTAGTNDTFCLKNTGNCFGAGGGVSSTGGTTNRIAMFTAGQQIGNSWLLQNGSNLELDNTRNLSLIGGNLSVTGNGTFTGTLQVNGNTTLGDAAGDTLTLNGTAVSTPNNLNIDSNTLYVDAANNRIGVGTTTPDGSLHIQGQAPSGTGTISSSGSTVTGSGTSFTTQLTIGDLITASGQTRTVSTITNNTSLTINAAFSPDLSAGTSFTYQKQLTRWANSSGSSVAALSPNGTLDLIQNGFTSTGISQALINVSGAINKGSLQNFYVTNFSSTINVSADPIFGDVLFRDSSNRALASGITDSGGSITFMSAPSVQATGASASTLGSGATGIVGLSTDVFLSKSGAGNLTVANVYGARLSAGSIATGVTVTNRYGAKVEEAAGAGSVANQYGLYMDNLVKGTNNYGIYLGGASTADIFFATDQTHTLKVQDQDTAATAGSALNVTGANGNTSGAGGAISITSGNGGGTGATNAGTITINNGTVSGAGTATINIGSANTTALNLGTAAVANTVTLGSSTGAAATNIQGGNSTTAVSIQSAASGTISIGTANVATKTISVGSVGSTAQATTINIANTTGNATQTINIGATNSANNAVLIQGGTTATAISLQSGTGGTISIGTAAAATVSLGAVGSTANASTINIANTTGNAAQTVSIGSASSTSTTTLNGRVILSGNQTKSAWGLSGTQLQVSNTTYTDSSTATSGTATNAVINSFGTPTLAASNTGVKTTNAANVYIQNAPAAGTNQTLTNAYALWVDDGASRFDGNVIVGNSTTPAQLRATGRDGTSGTGTISSSGQTVTGSGTAFLSEISVGTVIVASGQSRYVTAIASNTSLTVEASFSPNIGAGTSFNYRQPTATFTQGGNPDGELTNILYGDRADGTAAFGMNYDFSWIAGGSGVDPATTDWSTLAPQAATVAWGYAGSQRGFLAGRGNALFLLNPRNNGGDTGVDISGGTIVTRNQALAIGFGETPPGSDATIQVRQTIPAATTIGYRLKAAASQSADIFDITSSTGAALLSVNSGGALLLGTFNSSGGNVNVCRNATTGELGSCTSLRAYKKNIQNLNLGLDTINQLTPRQFNWKADGSADLGFVAEEVAAVNPLLGEYDAHGKLTGVKYSQMSALLTRGIQQLNVKTDQNTASITAQQQVDLQQANNILNINDKVTDLTSRVDALQNQVNNGQDGSFANLNVSGQATLAGLTVTGDATIQGELTVSTLHVTDQILVDGHIVTGGNAPTIAAADGQPITSTVDGTDTAGTITLTSNTGSHSGSLAQITFAHVFGKTPRVVLSPTTSAAANIKIYLEKTPTGFTLHTDDTPIPGQSYSFDYIVIE